MAIARTWGWKFKLLVSGWMLLCYSQPLVAQTNALVNSIRLQAEEGNFGIARSLLMVLWVEDSTSAYQVAEAAETSFLGKAEGESPTRGQADTLLRLYAIGRVHDPNGPRDWQIRQAMLAWRLPKFYERQFRNWAFQAIQTAPIEAPLFLYENWANSETKAYQAKQVPIKSVALEWSAIDRQLLVRELTQPAQASECASVRRHIHLLMRKALPDCNQLMGNFSEGIATGTLAPDICEAFLILYALQACDVPAIWEAGMRGAKKGGPNAWLNRLAANEAHNRGEVEESRNYWQQAFDLENSAALKAMDKLQIATSWMAAHEYRMARTAIQEAMQWNANWGAPYLQLMDLYVEGSKNCEMTAFERKALNWLLMDLCQQLQNADPTYAEEAISRLYSYKNEAPTNEEIAFRGLREGDTYPLKCWMNGTTTVKMRN